MELDIQIDTPEAAQVDESLLHQVVQETLRVQGVTEAVELGLLVVDDARIQALNRDYMGHDYATDVIAFGLEDAATDFATPPDGVRYLGDVVVSYPRAVAQAQEQGHAPARELACLVAHGVLHLLGHDDATPDERTAMDHWMEAIVAGVPALQPSAEPHQ
ncbi:MAG: rRNA maturation RNase YbeY [Chloroflexi bacterium]|nr:rRNA maturation RNase YbeY [Chloroflexota bacterium]MBU1751452.1 rRNA maturation RNase YbeY [Chloroflexota bacterium]